MNDARALGIGILGCGRAAVELHLPALARLPGARIAALADTDHIALDAAASRFGIRARAADVEGLLALPDVDVVAVCVPAAGHVDAALAVIEARRHLLIEKPLAPTLAGCERIIRAAQDIPGLFAVGFNLRFHRLIQAARAFIASGRLGRIEAIRSVWTSAIRRRRMLPEWRNDRATGGGALFEIAVHHFDLWRYLLNAGIERTYARGRTDDWPDETVTVSACMDNGVIANGLFSERSSDRNTLEVFGRDGSLSIDLFRYDGLVFSPADQQPGLATRLRKSVAAAVEVPRGIALMRQGGDFLLSYRRQWRAYIASIGGSGFEGATLNDGRAAVRAVLAAIESVDSGEPVRA